MHIRVPTLCATVREFFFLTGNVLQIQPSQALVPVVTLMIRSACSSSDEEVKIPQPEPNVRDVPDSFAQDEVEEEECTGAPKEDLLSWLAKYEPQLAVYEARLQCDSWDALQSLRLMTGNDMADLNILPGHCRLLVDTLKDL